MKGTRDVYAVYMICPRYGYYGWKGVMISWSITTCADGALCSGKAVDAHVSRRDDFVSSPGRVLGMRCLEEIRSA